MTKAKLWDVGYFRLRAGLAFVALAGCLTLAVIKAQTARSTGEELILKTRPIDPRDIFFGHYAVLSYDIVGNDLAAIADPSLMREIDNRTPSENEDNFSRVDPLYVSFEKVGAFHQPVWVTRQASATKGTSLKAYGRPMRNRYCKTVGEQDPCPVELRVVFQLPQRYYADRQTALALEDERRAGNQFAREEREFEQCEKERASVADNPDRQLSDRCANLIVPPSDDPANQFAVILSVDASGKAVIKGLIIDGKRVIDSLGGNRLNL